VTAEDLRRLAEEVAAEAAALLVEALSGVREIATKSSLTDMVTEMDRRSEALIVERLLAARPADGVLGEEGASIEGTSGVRWIIDPLDGTTNYLYRFPGFGVSIAAEASLDGGPPTVVAGAVADPSHGALYSAARGGGASRNGEVIAPSGEQELGRALVATGFSYDPERRRRQAAVLTEVLPRVRDIRRQGAAAVDLCLVANGTVDAFYERGLAPWDHAAGALIAAEAGALVGDLDGGPAGSAFALAASPALFEALRALLTSAGAADA
jgi:myo-inositol-1(or 4)-monophosphatase